MPELKPGLVSHGPRLRLVSIANPTVLFSTTVRVRAVVVVIPASRDATSNLKWRHRQSVGYLRDGPAKAVQTPRFIVAPSHAYSTTLAPAEAAIAFPIAKCALSNSDFVIFEPNSAIPVSARSFASASSLVMPSAFR